MATVNQASYTTELTRYDSAPKEVSIVRNPILSLVSQQLSAFPSETFSDSIKNILSLKQLRKLNGDEKLLEMLEKHVKIYEMIFENFKENSGYLIHKNQQIVLVTSTQLMKVTAKGLQLLKEHQSVYIQIDKKKQQPLEFLVTKQPGEFLVIGKEGKQIDSGATGRIKLFDVISSTVSMVAKFAKLEFDPHDLKSRERGIQCLKNEINALKLLHNNRKGEKIEGIQDPLFSTFTIRAYDETITTMGYITTYYEGGSCKPLLFHERFKGNEALSLVRQVFSGIAYAHRFNLVHNDISPSNLFIRKNPNQMLEICLGDWGFAGIYPNRKQNDIRKACETLYEILTGINLCGKMPCSETRAELIKIKDNYGSAHEERWWDEPSRAGSYEAHRLHEIDLPRDLVSLIEKGLYSTSQNYPQPEAFIETIDKILLS